MRSSTEPSHHGRHPAKDNLECLGSHDREPNRHAHARSLRAQRLVDRRKPPPQTDRATMSSRPLRALTPGRAVRSHPRLGSRPEPLENIVLKLREPTPVCAKSTNRRAHLRDIPFLPAHVPHYKYFPACSSTLFHAHTREPDGSDMPVPLEGTAGSLEGIGGNSAEAARARIRWVLTARSRAPEDLPLDRRAARCLPDDCALDGSARSGGLAGTEPRSFSRKPRERVKTASLHYGSLLRRPRRRIRCHGFPAGSLPSEKPDPLESSKWDRAATSRVASPRGARH